MATLDQVKAAIRDLASALDLDRPGAGAATFGAELLDLVLEGHLRRARAQKAPDGSKWAKNAPAYARSRRKRGKRVGELSGAMLSEAELKGARRIAPDRATVRYGSGEETRLRMKWFHEGTRRKGKAHQPARPAWGLDAEITRDIGLACLSRLREARRRHGG